MGTATDGGIIDAEVMVDTAIRLQDLHHLVARRLGAETAGGDVSAVCKRLYTLALTPRGQELTTALPPHLWAEVVELTPILEQFRDIIEGLRLFRLLRPYVDLGREFIEGV